MDETHCAGRSLAVFASYGASAQTADQLVKGRPTLRTFSLRHGIQSAAFSPLTQISKDNAKNLVPVWNYSLPMTAARIAALVYQGIVYVTTHNATMAIDAKTGKQV